MEDGYTSTTNPGAPHSRRGTQAETNHIRIKSQSNGGGRHKRTLSGSILSKLSFLRTPQTEEDLKSDTEPDDENNSGGMPPKHHVNEMAGAVQQHKKTRRRKGSLRKTALLGTGKLGFEGRERSGSALRLFHYDSVTKNEEDKHDGDYGDHVQIHPASPQKFGPPNFTYFPSNGASFGRNAFADHTIRPSSEDGRPMHEFPMTSPTLGDASTTDEDEMITIPHHIVNGSAATQMLKKPSSSGSDSYFPPQLDSLQHRRPINKPKSPLGTLASGPTKEPEEWDYSATEWWGWVVLVVTWIVFVVGMGSCFGVWSWAWDVGETPYAPPELEDDPTLPIVGYYPALIILTAVMAWVWVVIAWVGMKYFKHAKITGEGV
ncbi:MAG: hypothetical protein M1835_006246 [Candelina submexicana]|nr:MAG: hypothetical protein M1835_006246 [Candelina submexicana]